MSTLDTRETKVASHSLISSDRVDGTAVYGADRNKIGSIEELMIDKISGKVAYAVLSFGGFLGMGDEHYPLPWSTLKYDTSLGGYIVNLTKDQLDKAPKYHPNDSWDWSRPNDQRVHEYYKARPYWGV
jgi:PRC-barrel domain